MIEKQYLEFLNLLNKEEKDKAITYILNLLKNNDDIIGIYQNFLIPSLANFSCDLKNQEICVWREHTRTSIIRTIIEASYPYIIEKRKNTIKKKVIVVCPQEEYHEIGAIISNNYFSLVGFDSMYIGANTPSQDILSAVRILKPDYIALSVTNYYNLFVTDKLTKEIKSLYPNVKVIIGGQAFKSKEAKDQITYDHYLNSYDDILAFSKEVVK